MKFNITLKGSPEIRRKANESLMFGISNVLAWGDVAACLFMTPLKPT